MHIGRGIKQAQAQQVAAWMDSWLGDGEVLLGIIKLNKVTRPRFDAVVVSNARLFFVEMLVTGHLWADRRTISRAEVVRRGINRYLMLSIDGAEPTKYGQVLTGEDAAALEQLLGQPVDIDAAEAASQRMEEEQAEAQVAQAGMAELEQAVRASVIGRIGNAQVAETLAHCAQGERPRFVLAEGSSGALAAFDDRCVIIKKGALTSMMAGSLGGGRVTVFPYTDITGIEFNSGMVTGVLEILTPSYQGTANKDFWRGSTKSRNADSNDPYTLSNTLPLSKPLYEQARPRIEEMRRLISEAKRPQTHQQPALTNKTLSDEIAALAALRDQGALDDEEFRAAKAAAIARSA